MQSNEEKWQKGLDFSSMAKMLTQMKDVLTLLKQEQQRKYDDLMRLKIQQSKQNGVGKEKV